MRVRAWDSACVRACVRVGAVQAEKTLETNAKRVFSGRALVDWLLLYEGDKFGGNNKAGDQNGKDGDDDDAAGAAGISPQTANVDGVMAVNEAVMVGGAGGIVGRDREFARSFCDDMQQVRVRAGELAAG